MSKSWPELVYTTHEDRKTYNYIATVFARTYDQKFEIFRYKRSGLTFVGYNSTVPSRQAEAAGAEELREAFHGMPCPELEDLLTPSEEAMYLMGTHTVVRDTHYSKLLVMLVWPNNKQAKILFYEGGITRGEKQHDTVRDLAYKWLQNAPSKAAQFDIGPIDLRPGLILYPYNVDSLWGPSWSTERE